MIQLHSNFNCHASKWNWILKNKLKALWLLMLTDYTKDLPICVKIFASKPIYTLNKFFARMHCENWGKNEKF